MATWTTRQAIRGIAECRWGAPCGPPSAPTPSTPPIPTSPWSGPAQTSADPEVDCMDDSGFYDWLESQMSVTGEMTVVERLQYLLDTGQFADINIRVGQGNNATVFKAHRLLLATASQALYRMVYQVCPNPGPQEVTTIRVTDMQPKDFENILKYIYTDNIDCKNINVAFELLRASKKWGLAGLGIKSLTFLEEFIDSFKPTTEESKSNLFDLLVLSEETLNEISEKCWRILLKEADVIIPCEGFLNLDQDMIKKVICHKDLKFENHLKLFEAIRDWGLRYVQNNNLKLTQLGSVVEELIKVIDFDRISDTDFINTVLTSECLGKAEVIAFFMTHGLEIPRNLDFNNNKQLPFWLWFCATSDLDGKAWQGRKGRAPHANNRKASKHNSQLATVNETLSNICSLTQNGNVLEFNKVCRFRKGYRCPQKEIQQEHELRFRVDKNIRLLGVGFGFLFSCTDMGINVHCQGPWETRQWTDITQSYCRVSGEKQETADVRLMFLHPVRIEANHSYKVLVKLVRMSSGSSEVELWGGTGGVYCVETEDAEFYFLKAAVDPSKTVEESDGETKPGVITELLYKMDTGEPEPPVSSIPRRRRPPPQEEEEEESSPRRRRPEAKEEEAQQTAETPRRRRQRPEVTLKVPETPYVRKRSPPADDHKPAEAPPPSRRREAADTTPSYSSSKTPTEEYKPETFSSNRWRTRTRDTDSEYKKPVVEEYKPTSFSTNRWITKPKDTKSDSDKTADTSYYSSHRTTGDKPASYSTSSWRTRVKEDEPDHKKLADSLSYSSRKTSTEESKPDSLASSRWRTRSREEATDTPFGNRKVKKANEDTSPASHPFMRRRDSKESTSDVPFFLRPRPSQSEESKTTGSALGRSRWATTSSSSSASDDRPSTTTPTRSRFLHTTDSVGSSSLRPSGSSSLLSSRYGGTRDSSFTRPRDSSFSRYGGSSGSSYISRYDTSSKAGGSEAGSSGTGSRYSSVSAPPGGYSRTLGGSGSRYGSSATTDASAGTVSATSSRYSSPAPTKEPVRYGTSTTGSGSNLAALSSKYGSSGTGSSSSTYASAGTTSGTSSRYRSLSDSAGGYGKHSSPGPAVGSSSRYGSSASTGRHGSPGPTSRSDKYGSPAPASGSGGCSRYGSSASTGGSTSAHSGVSCRYSSSASGGRYGSPTATRRSVKHGSPAPAGGSSGMSGSSRYGSSTSTSKYSSPTPSSRTGKYSSPAPAASSGSSGSSRYGSSASTGKYGSPAPTSGSGRYGSPARTAGISGSTSSRYGSPARTGGSSSSSRYGSPARTGGSSSSSRYGSSGSSSRSNMYGGGGITTSGPHVAVNSTSSYASTPSSEGKWSPWGSDGGYKYGSDALSGSRYDSGYDGSGDSGTGSGS